MSHLAAALASAAFAVPAVWLAISVRSIESEPAHELAPVPVLGVI